MCWRACVKRLARRQRPRNMAVAVRGDRPEFAPESGSSVPLAGGSGKTCLPPAQALRAGLCSGCRVPPAMGLPAVPSGAQAAKRKAYFRLPAAVFSAAAASLLSGRQAWAAVRKRAGRDRPGILPWQAVKAGGNRPDRVSVPVSGSLLNRGPRSRRQVGLEKIRQKERETSHDVSLSQKNNARGQVTRRWPGQYGRASFRGVCGGRFRT